MSDTDAMFTEREREVIDRARCLLTFEAFVHSAAVDAAMRLLATTTPGGRHGAVPAFIEVER